MELRVLMQQVLLAGFGPTAFAHERET